MNKEKRFYSQDGQDKFLVNFFREKSNGVFLDIGAYDGISFSNTYYLEKELHWNGICIEPNPIPFANPKKTEDVFHSIVELATLSHKQNFWQYQDMVKC